MKSFTTLLLSFTILALGCQSKSGQKENEPSASVNTAAAETGQDNSLSDQEKQEGWELLFDGKSTDKWRGAQKDQFPEEGWKIEDGVLMVMESGGAESQHGGDIVTKEEFSDFELKLDFKITPGANSGVKYFVTEEHPTDGSAIGLEYQILDDEKHPDAKKGNNGVGTRTLASLYDLIPAKDKNVNPVGAWNHARIVVKGKHVEHWLNGEKVLEYERGSDQYNQLVKNSKYNKYKDFGLAEKGHILLQDHGNRVYFKNIKMRELPAS